MEGQQEVNSSVVRNNINATMTESEYRAIPIDSYSTLKIFDEDPKKYYRKFILNEVVKEEDSEALAQGDLVDCLYHTPELFEEKFAVSISEVPTGQYFKYVNELMKQTMFALNRETNEVSRSLESMMEDAYNACKFDRDGNIVDFKRDSFEVVKRKFIGTELQVYYEQLRNSVGKRVVDLSMIENANAVVNELKSNFVTSGILNQVTDENVRVLHQFPIIGEIDSTITQSIPYPLKCLVDKLVIDSTERKIKIYDLKTCWDNEREFMRNYLKYKYYLQDAIYYYLVVEWARKQRGLETYTVEYPIFIVAETSNYKNPLMYTTSQQNFRQGMLGFTINNRKYSGVVELVKDLMWHKENAIWNISHINHINNGVVAIPVFQ